MTARFENVARPGSNLTTTMKVDGEVVASKVVTPPTGGNGTAQVTFEYTFTSPGERNVTVNNRTVRVAVERPTANLTLDRVSVDRQSIRPGESVTVTAAVRNDGTAEGNRTLELEAFGEPVARETVTVSPGQVRSVTFDQRFTAAGDYTLRVNGTPVEVEVASASSPSSTALSSDLVDTNLVAPGILAVIVTFVALGAVLFRRM